MPTTRLLVLSDIHAEDSRFLVPIGANPPATSPGQASWLNYGNRLTPSQDPILSLQDLISATNLRADFLVVPGDLCDKANGAALRLIWTDLERIRVAIGATATIATAGNHDLDSRFRANAYDPTAGLLGLSPPFPVTEPARARFWAYGISEVISGDVRFVIHNSCAYHGGASGEIDHGRISPYTLGLLKAMVSEPSSSVINVFLTHHHVFPFPRAEPDKDDRTIDGESIIEMLDASGNNWLLIHGHLHAARLLYAAGSASSPVILAAGSTSVRLAPPLATSTTNQLHLLTVSADGFGDLHGVVDSWTYRPYIGWEVSATGAGLPHRCGFGYRGSLDALVNPIASSVTSNNGPVSWVELVKDVPQIEYLTPRDFELLQLKATQKGFALVPASTMYEAAAL
jgi:3',5'-cyclic AMP phosphodiesterase CpdA